MRRPGASALPVGMDGARIAHAAEQETTGFPVPESGAELGADALGVGEQRGGALAKKEVPRRRSSTRSVARLPARTTAVRGARSCARTPDSLAAREEGPRNEEATAVDCRPPYLLSEISDRAQRLAAPARGRSAAPISP